MKIKRTDLGRFALLLLAISSQNTVYGRTKLQKMVYLANECGWNAVRDYVFYQYGPYSEWVALQLENLSETGVIKEEPYKTGNERIVYKYSITEKGSSLLEAILKELNVDDLVQKTKDLLKELSEYNAEGLEIMASLISISKDKDLDKDSIVKTVDRLKPRFGLDEIKKYTHVFDILERFKN